MQTLGAVIDRKERGHIRQERLGSTDVARGLIPADMLLAGLKRHAVGRPSACINGYPNNPAGHHPHKGLFYGHEGRMGPAVTHRNPKTLSRADSDIGPHAARRFHEH